MPASGAPDRGRPVVAAVRLAVGTCTIWPTGAVQVNQRMAGQAMVLAPLAVAPVAAVAAGLGWLAAAASAPGLLAGLLVVGVLAVGTRALHLDGLADTADGLGSGRPPVEALQIMRRGDIGPMGVVTLVLVLAGQASAFGGLLDSGRAALAVAVLIGASRSALALLCAAGVPAARADGLGAAVAGSVARPAVAATWVVTLGALTLAGWLAGGPVWLGAPIGVVAGLAVAALGRRCVRRLGGVTGDVLGAGVEVCLTVLVASVALGRGWG